MVRGRCAFRQTDITRVLRAAKDARVPIKIEIEPDRMTVTTISDNSGAPRVSGENEWDEVFKDDGNDHA
jgi:hypothetical protein